MTSASDLGAVWRYRGLWRNLVRRDLRVKYKGSSLGFAWSLLHPLVMAAVYTVAFQYVLRVPVERFPLFLLSGLLPWMFFSTGVLAASSSIVDHGSLVRKVAFPRLVLPLSAVTSQFVQFAMMYALIVPLVVAWGGTPGPWLVALVPVAALQFLFTLGLGLALAAAYVQFRDTRHLLEVLLQVWFWVTPIVYSAALLPDRLRPLFALNPMAYFVDAYHTVVVDERLPGATTFGVLAALALASTLAGLAVFRGRQRRFAEMV